MGYVYTYTRIHIITHPRLLLLFFLWAVHGLLGSVILVGVASPVGAAAQNVHGKLLANVVIVLLNRPGNDDHPGRGGGGGGVGNRCGG